MANGDQIQDPPKKKNPFVLDQNDLKSATKKPAEDQQPKTNPFVLDQNDLQNVKKKDGTPASGTESSPTASPSSSAGATNTVQSGPKMSDLLNQTQTLLNESIPTSPDPKINGKRQELLSGVKEGNQGAILTAKNYIKTGIQKQIDDIKRASYTSAGGRVPTLIYSPSPVQKAQLDALDKKQKQADEVLNEYAVHAAAGSKEIQTQVRAEVSGKQYGAMPNIAAEDMGKIHEKIYGGIPNPNGNIQYERQKTGFEDIIRSKTMKMNDLRQAGLATKNAALIQQADQEQAEISQLKSRHDNLIDQFPDVAVTQVSRMIGDEIAENSPRQGIITKGAVEESARRIEAKHPGFLAKYGKFINVVEEKPGLVPEGDLVGLGGLRAGLYDIQYGAASFVAGLVGDEQTKEFADKMKESPALKGTKPTHATQTNVVYDNKGNAFVEKPDQDYGKISWNSSTRFIGQSIPGLAEWVVAEEATGGVAGLAGAGKAAKASLGLVGASYVTSYDANHKVAESLIDDNSTLGEAKKTVLANLFTLTTAGAFKLVGYSPTKFVENAVTKAIAPDILEALEANGWKALPKNKVVALMTDKIIPKVKTFAIESAKSVGEGSKVASAQLADQKVKDFVSQVVNPEKANASTADENIKSFAQQTLFMSLLGLPRSVVAGFDSPSTKDALYEIGTRAPQYIDRINEGLANGEYTQEQANKMIATAKTMGEEVAKAQFETTKDGLLLTVKQKRDVAVQNFRKRAAAGMKESGFEISDEKVKNDADEQIKNTKSENTHLPLEKTEAFATAVEVDKEGKEIGKPKSPDDIEGGNIYRYQHNGKETTTSGLELISRLPNSKEYEEPKAEDAGNAKGETQKTETPESKIPESKLPEEIKTELSKIPGVYGEMGKKDPDQLLKEIAQQAQGVDADGLPVASGGDAEKALTDYGVPEKVIEVAKETYPAPKLEELRPKDEAQKILDQKITDLGKDKNREIRKKGIDKDVRELKEKHERLDKVLKDIQKGKC